MAKVTASYFIVVQSHSGDVQQWMWNCEACPGVGLATTEAAVIDDMNAHVLNEHSDDDYVETAPISE